eukprot:scaffold10670_cov142-Isochrysis_galbana.AAC.7
MQQAAASRGGTHRHHRRLPQRPPNIMCLPPKPGMNRAGHPAHRRPSRPLPRPPALLFGLTRPAHPFTRHPALELGGGKGGAGSPGSTGAAALEPLNAGSIRNGGRRYGRARRLADRPQRRLAPHRPRCRGCGHVRLVLLRQVSKRLSRSRGPLRPAAASAGHGRVRNDNRQDVGVGTVRRGLGIPRGGIRPLGGRLGQTEGQRVVVREGGAFEQWPVVRLSPGRSASTDPARARNRAIPEGGGGSSACARAPPSVGGLRHKQGLGGEPPHPCPGVQKVLPLGVGGWGERRCVSQEGAPQAAPDERIVRCHPGWAPCLREAAALPVRRPGPPGVPAHTPASPLRPAPAGSPPRALGRACLLPASPAAPSCRQTPRPSAPSRPRGRPTPRRSRPRRALARGRRPARSASAGRRTRPDTPRRPSPRVAKAR